MNSRKPITIDLVDNREYQLIRDGKCYLQDPVTKKKICVAGEKGKARWNNPQCWDAVRKFVADARANPKGSQIFILREDCYSHDTEDDFLTVKFERQDFSVHTGNLVGSIVRSGEEAGDAVGRVSIGSRFGDAFLRHIISDADGFLAVNDGGGSDESHDGYDWLLGYLWNVKFKNAYRLGMPKCYTTKHESLVAPRGQIDVLGYYAYSKRGRVSCEYRDLSYDNPAASLFVQTWKVLNSKASTQPFCGRTANICQAFQQATRGITRKNSELLAVRPFVNAFYSEYNKLIDLSKAILKHWGSEFSTKNRADAILFDISMLFEYYLRKLLKRNGFQMVPKETEYLTIPTGTKMGKLKPDLVFGIGDGVGVFDVKYKYFKFSEGVRREDVFQLHTYIGQYGNHQAVRACGFLYPITEKRWRDQRKDAAAERVVLTFPMSQQMHETIFCVGFLVIPSTAENNMSSSDFRRELSPWIDRLVHQLGEVFSTAEHRRIGVSLAEAR